jgi:formylglycine-generating enzyme required for sulfatase activity
MGVKKSDEFQTWVSSVMENCERFASSTFTAFKVFPSLKLLSLIFYFVLTSCSKLVTSSVNGPEKYVFPGISSLGVQKGGVVRLSWPAVPDSGVVYSVHARKKSSEVVYNLASEPLLKTSETLAETKPLPLNETYCFMVRAVGDNYKDDANTKEVCTTDDGVADFTGISTATSIVSGQVNITWVKSVDPNVSGYRIYQGNDFILRIGVADGTANAFTLSGLPPGEKREFGVRAFDKNGREDNNQKSVLVLISDAVVAAGDFPGCVSATGLDVSSIEIKVAFPNGASGMKVYRDGMLLSLMNVGTTTLIDDRLSEGSSYTYRCEALINGIPTQGTAQLTGSTQNINPPNFSGLDSAVASTGQVVLNWSTPGVGPKASEYKIYRSVGLSAPALTSANLVASVSGDALTKTITGLGDELKYTFVVVACSSGQRCSGGSKSVTTATLPDSGYPTTVGATAARMANGKAVLTVPWNHAQGAISKRKIYKRNPSGTDSIGGYAYDLLRSESVTDIYNPPLELEVGSLLANTTYYFVVRDEDTQSPANVSLNTSVVSVNSGDIDPPNFSGITSLNAGANVETQLSAVFTAVAPEGTGAGQSSTGVSQYLVYKTEAIAPATPANPCSATTISQQVDAQLYTAGQSVTVNLTGLTSRRHYSVCIKARDTAGNISSTVSYFSRSTSDTTPPLFDGINTLTFNNSSEKLEVRWAQATSSLNDVKNYRVVLYRCAASTLPDCTGSTDTVLVTSASSTGVDLSKSTFSPALQSNDKVSVKVNACDDASPTYAQADNCTATTRVQSVTLPDIDPPAGFSEISSAAAESGVEGAVRVSWSAPASWVDYRGFKVYTVQSNEALTMVKDCACTANGCSEHLTSCIVNGLDAKRTYNFYVRAYDQAGNYTALPSSPYGLSRPATTLDLTAPTFTPSLSATFVGTGTRGVNLTWAAASDNQSSSEPGALITYKLYRKVGSSFAGFTASAAPSDGSLLLSTTSLSYLNEVVNLTANTTDYYAVCALDTSLNIKCAPSEVRSVVIPRLNPPVFPGLSSVTVGDGSGFNKETTITLNFSAIASETTDPSNGATSYSIYTTDAFLPTEPGNACTSTSPAPTARGSILGTSYTANQAVAYVLPGLTARKKYSICLKARDSAGNESTTTTALTAQMQDSTAPTFTGLQNATYNAGSNTVDLTWTPPAGSDLRNYKIKIWKSPSGTPSDVIKSASQGSSGTVAISKTDFDFSSNDQLNIVVNACDDAAPTYGASDNCTAFADNTARQINLPDVTPPTGFAGATSVTDFTTRATGTARVNWAAPSGGWADYRGFKIYDVLGTTTLLKDCPCLDYGCSNQILTCDVGSLDAGRTYRFYVRGYDAAGNETAIANPNPISNYKTFRTADLIAPNFTGSLGASYQASGTPGISLSWGAATDNQYTAEPNTIGYRVYRKSGSTFTSLTRSTIEAEGTQRTLSLDTNRTYLDPTSGLSDGTTYYYTVCAFDREPGVSGGNTTCDGAVRSVTVPDITPPMLSGLSGSRSILTRDNPSFNLSWMMSDNITSSSQLVVTVRRNLLATTATDFPSPTDTIYLTSAGLMTLTGETGLNDVDSYITYRITVADAAGNELNTSTFAIQSKRQALPTVISSPSASMVGSSTSALFTLSYSAAATVDSNATLATKVTVNTVSGSFACTKTVTGSGVVSRTVTLSSCTGNGSFTISVAAGTALDSAGNVSSAAGPSGLVTVDNLPPVLTTTSPAANTQINSTFTLTGTCETGLSVVISGSGISGSPQTASCSGGVFSKALSLIGAEGNKVLTLSEDDGVNSNSVSLTLIKDTIAPSLAISLPANATVINNSNSNLVLSGTCESGYNVVIEGDVPAGQTTPCTSGVFSFGVWQLDSGDGVKSVTIRQTDLAGNTTAVTRSYTLNTTPVPVGSMSQLDASTVAIKALHVSLSGTCDSDSAFQTTAVTTFGRLQSVSCTTGLLTVNVTDFPDGRNSFTVTVTTTRIINGLTRSSSQTYTYQFFCPKGYVGIPGKFATDADVAGLGNPSASAGNADGGLDPTRDFCVMKYHAKAATSNASSQTPFEPVYDGNKTFTPMSNYWPESRADSTPWVNISSDNSALRCRALNETLGTCTGSGCDSWDNANYGYRLMSNTQWQAAARNLENTGANWTSGTVGSGYLWRGHSDNGVGSNTDLYTQTFSGSLAISSPRSDTGNSDYFGTGNSANQNSSGTSGWQERRRFVTSNGRSLWDFAGNVWQWVSDNYSTLSMAPAIGVGWGEYSFTPNFPVSGVNRLNFAPSGSYNSSQNTGQFYGGSAGAVRRGGGWSGYSNGGLFSALLGNGPTGAYSDIGFRCAFLPPLPPPSPLDTGSPVVTLQRVDNSGSGVANTAVTVGAGGFWNLGISITDAENIGSDVNKLYVQVRRKVSASGSDFPASTDPVYQGGYNLTTLQAETAWVQDPTTGQYTRNDNMFVNYLVRVKDPSGNVGSSTFSVANTKSCPPGYVGVPGSATTGLGSPLATINNTNKGLDPSLDFCVMKYPAKVMSAGTTGTSSAQSTVGGLFEPIMNGSNTFTNDYTYTDATSFNNKVIYLPESRPSGTPWVNISRDNSISACQAQQMQYLGSMPDTTNGGGFQLISNTQWQVVARNAEAVSSNWSGNSVGTGKLNRGHSDNTISATEVMNSWCFGCTSPSTSLSGAPNSVSDNNGYFATGAGTTYAAWNTLGASPTAGSEQKRTTILSNGRLIWDFGGNVWQWVSDNYSTLSMAPAIAGSWGEYSNTTNFPVSGVNRLNFAPSGSYNSTQNAGQLHGGSAGAVLRGGDWVASSNDGLFSANLNGGPTNTYYSFGFRCVYNPPPTTGTVSGMAPEIKALGRVTDLDDFMENSAVNIVNGGSWNLKWAVSDAETATSSLTVEVRRKIASTATDFPIGSDAVYASGNGSTLTKLTGETAWQSTSVTNNSKFVNYLITVQDLAGNSTSQTFSVNNTASCPSGYVGVPGNSTAGLGSPLATINNATGSLDPSRAFCVMKYPAKNVGSVATSVPSGTPWVSITRDTAATTCSSLGTGFGLISNTQWQVVARNAENVASNWSGGAVGTGVLNRGHSDTSPNNPLANTADDTDGYFGTGNTGFTSQAWSGLGATPAAGAEQKRTYILSNGKVVWDFGGNVLQWVGDNISTLNLTPAIATNAWTEFSDTTNFPVSGVNRLNFAPGGSYNSSQNVGLLFGGGGNVLPRGSHYSHEANSGLFSSVINLGLTFSGGAVGFRCAFLP